MTITLSPARRTALLAAFGLILATTCSLSLRGQKVSASRPPAAPQVVANAPSACAALAGKNIATSVIAAPTKGAVVTSATHKSAVPDKVETLQGRGPVVVQATPDYCELRVDILPVDPQAPPVRVQANLPTSWNGRYLQSGGAGYNGVVISGVQTGSNVRPETPLPLTQGYMTAGDDGGHEAARGPHYWDFALNAEALTNFTYAAYGKTHDVVRELGRLYYGRTPSKSYFMGGSEGGREGMLMAQRFPTYFDGIVSIDPVMNWTGLQTFGNYVGGVLQSAPGAWLGPKWQLVHDTVAGACDALDGIADGVVSNYKACRAAAAFTAKRCPSGGDESPACFSDAQLSVLRALKSGYQFSFPLANGMKSYAGYNYGGEGVLGNSGWVTGTAQPNPDPSQSGGRTYVYGSGYVRYFIARDPDFNPLTYRPENFAARVLEVSGMMDTTNPDLTAFFSHGGKLILREDLSDSAQSPLTGLNYWDAVVAKMGKSTVEKFFAAYVSTGLPHMSGGIAPGSANAPSYGIPGRVDLLAPLVDWVEEGTAPPAQMTLTNYEALPPYKVISSKPMCRYGTYPKYTGATPQGGNEAANYSCVQ